MIPHRLRSDDRLARQAAAGDTDAFGVLYERHHRPLYRYCRSIVADPDDAADALQAAMTRALAAIGDRDERAPVRAWLFRIAHNESVSLLRKRRGAEPLDPESLMATDVEADVERRRRLAQLVSDLQQLSERQRGALLMRELGGLGHAEIAAALQTSEGAVKQAIFEARTALSELVAGRELACAAVRRRLSDGDGRTARARPLRAHLHSCSACREFRAELLARRTELAAIAPVVPAVTAAAVLDSVVAGGAGVPVALGLSKTVAVGAVTVAAGAGAVTFTAIDPELRSPARPPEARVVVVPPGPAMDDAVDPAVAPEPSGGVLPPARRPSRRGSVRLIAHRERPDGTDGSDRGAVERGERPSSASGRDGGDRGSSGSGEGDDRGTSGSGRDIDDRGSSGSARDGGHRASSGPGPGDAGGRDSSGSGWGGGDHDSSGPRPGGDDDRSGPGPGAEAVADYDAEQGASVAASYEPAPDDGDDAPEPDDEDD